MINKKRVEWIDFCKFIAIFCMVWGHVGLPKSIDIYIHAFHMPIFFFLSGYFLNLDKYDSISNLIKNRGKTLLVPYFIFGIGLCVFWNTICLIWGYSEKIASIKICIKSILLTNTTIIPFGAVQWFLTCLFITEILFYIVCKYSKKNNKILLISLIILSIIGYIFSKVASFRLIWGADVAFIAVLFYGVGFLFRNNKSRISKYIYESKISYIIILFLISIISIKINGYVNMRTMTYGNYILFYFNAFVLICVVMMFSNYISKIEILCKSKIYKMAIYIGKNTIIVLLMNRVFETILKVVFKSQITSNNKVEIFLIQILMTIIILLIMIPISKLINKYCPKILGRNYVR